MSDTTEPPAWALEAAKSLDLAGMLPWDDHTHAARIIAAAAPKDDVPASQSKEVGITELVRLIGDENIDFQNVVANLVQVQNPKHGKFSKITITIPPDIGQELAAAAGVCTPRKTGLLMWIDTEKVNAAMKGAE